MTATQHWNDKGVRPASGRDVDWRKRGQDVM